jgi:hypothetical protein
MLARVSIVTTDNTHNKAMDRDGTRGWWASSNVSEENDMKKLATTVAFLSIGLLSNVAMPAFAQSYTPEFGTGNVAAAPPNQSGEASYAQAPDNYEIRGRPYHIRRPAASRYHSSYDANGTNQRQPQD